MFKDALTLCTREYRRHEWEKNNTWLVMELETLEDLFDDALTDYQDGPSPAQIVDIINLGLMIIEREYMKIYVGEED